MSDFINGCMIGGIIVLLLIVVVLGGYTYPVAAESNAKFLCESKGLILAEFERTWTSVLTSVTCKESQSVPYYYERMEGN